MKHLAIIQSEFLKEARKWDDLSLEDQRAYLKRHPSSKRRLTAKLDTNQQNPIINKLVTKMKKLKRVDDRDSQWVPPEFAVRKSFPRPIINKLFKTLLQQYGVGDNAQNNHFYKTCTWRVNDDDVEVTIYHNSDKGFVELQTKENREKNEAYEKAIKFTTLKNVGNVSDRYENFFSELKTKYPKKQKLIDKLRFKIEDANSINYMSKYDKHSKDKTEEAKIKSHKLIEELRKEIKDLITKL